jgi:hypothetical protein
MGCAIVSGVETCRWVERCTVVLLSGSGKLEWGEKKVNHWKFIIFSKQGDQ